MQMIDLFVAELDREAMRSRRALEVVPADKRSWKPHERSMEFGHLTDMVATMPSWFAMIIQQDQLDVAPKDGGRKDWPQPANSAEYIAALEKSVQEAKAALAGTTPQHLETNWRLLAGGQVVLETHRHEMLRDTMNHWVHHRGQMTVYLRLMGEKVPALYGPSADDKRFD